MCGNKPNAIVPFFSALNLKKDPSIVKEKCVFNSVESYLLNALVSVKKHNNWLENHAWGS